MYNNSGLLRDVVRADDFARFWRMVFVGVGGLWKGMALGTNDANGGKVTDIRAAAFHHG